MFSVRVSKSKYGHRKCSNYFHRRSESTRRVHLFNVFLDKTATVQARWQKLISFQHLTAGTAKVAFTKIEMFWPLKKITSNFYFSHLYLTSRLLERWKISNVAARCRPTLIIRKNDCESSQTFRTTFLAVEPPSFYLQSRTHWQSPGTYIFWQSQNTIRDLVMVGWQHFETISLYLKWQWTL